MSTLKSWAERVIRVVESGATAKRIRLTTDGNVWHTWEAPFPSVDDWTQEAEDMLIALAEELPTRRVSMTFTAEDGAGAVLSTTLKSVTGKNKVAAELGANQHAKAQADAMASLAATMETILRLARLQCETSGTQLEKQAQQIHDLIELNRARQEASLLEENQSSNAQAKLVEQFTEAAPMLLQALGSAMTKKTPLAAVPPIASEK
jgi:hypothetical protein